MAATHIQPRQPGIHQTTVGGLIQIGGEQGPHLGIALGMRSTQ